VLPGKARSKVAGGGSGGAKKTRRVPIQRRTDVAVPVERAYEAWTSFDEFPKFMRRVLNVERKGRNKVSWQEKIFQPPAVRSRDHRAAQERPDRLEDDERDVAQGHRQLPQARRQAHARQGRQEFEPSGMIEKMASRLRFVKRAVQADLARFKPRVEMQDAKGLDLPRRQRRRAEGAEPGEER